MQWLYFHPIVILKAVTFIGKKKKNLCYFRNKMWIKVIIQFDEHNSVNILYFQKIKNKNKEFLLEEIF